jgi:hypothetical protein
MVRSDGFFDLAKKGLNFQCFAVRMITRLFSAALRGVEAQEVEVEVNARGADKPMVIIVGMTFTLSQPTNDKKVTNLA